MHLVVGLGNPGKEYENTRHNVGFKVIDYLSQKFNFDMSRERFKGMFGESIIKGEKVLFLKPLTYMNLSGESVIEAVNFYKIPVENVIIIYDDMAIETGKLRLRPSGSDGGHNGMKSLINHLGTKEFKRIRVGIGKEEETLIEKSVAEAGDAAISIIEIGIQNAMNKHNSFSPC